MGVSNTVKRVGHAVLLSPRELVTKCHPAPRGTGQPGDEGDRGRRLSCARGAMEQTLAQTVCCPAATGEGSCWPQPGASSPGRSFGKAGGCSVERQTNSHTRGARTTRVRRPRGSRRQPLSHPRHHVCANSGWVPCVSLDVLTTGGFHLHVLYQS